MLYPKLSLTMMAYLQNSMPAYMKTLLKIAVAVWLCGWQFPATAQQNALPHITGDFRDLAANDFLLQLEKQTGYHFYFDTAQIDSVRVNISIKDKPLTEAIRSAFENTTLDVAYYEPDNIFISKGLVVQTQLPDGFFPGSTPRTNKPERGIVDYASAPQPATNSNLASKLYSIGDPANPGSAGPGTVTGFVLDDKTGAPVIGASVHVENTKTYVATDQFGYYTIAVPKGRHTLSIQSIGMKDTKREVQVFGDGKFNIEMQGQIISLKNVVVSAEKASNIRSLQMGLQTIDIKTIKQVPVVFGEADVLRVVLTLPGVKSVGEASTGLNVRGGASDQNLILFNDATIYNPSHFFGLFSAFNPEVVKNVELYKASVPAKYGGRLSSVLEINSRDGNKKEMAGTAGIGLLTSRLTLEGPLVKDKSSFIIGGRSTYAKWLLNLLPKEYENSEAGFYDVNLNISHEINKKNSLFLTGYLSGDKFNLNSDTAYRYGNKNISLKWKHIFNNKVYMLVSGGHDLYEYSIESTVIPFNG